jgi:hypothetical protein
MTTYLYSQKHSALGGESMHPTPQQADAALQSGAASQPSTKHATERTCAEHG